MIIGKGNIASVLKNREDLIYFASGVSDSSETSESEFFRERNLLLKQNKEKHLVYFSSLSIYYNKNAYNIHKKEMEQLVRDNFKSYTIIRVEVIAWGKNKTTIHNVFRKKLANGETIDIQDTFRYIIYTDEFLYWLALIPVGEKNEMNITGQPYTIQQIFDLVKEGKL